MTNTVESLLQGAATTDWLVAELSKTLSSRSLWHQALGLGLVIRLWSPQRGKAGEYAEKLRKGWVSPSAHAVNQAKLLTPTAIQQLNTMFQHSCYAFMELLDVFQAAITSKSDTAVDLGERVRIERDNLECIRIVLACTNQDTQLLTNTIDKAGLAAVVLWNEIQTPYSARLGSVSWQEPDAWWGAIGLD